MNKENADIVWAIWKEISKERFADIKSYHESEEEKFARREELNSVELALESILSKLEDKVITGTMDNELIFRDKTAEEKRLEKELVDEANRLTSGRN